MVSLIRTTILLLATALTAQACSYCQCRFADGSNCCVYSNVVLGNLDCTEYCAKAKRADGKANADGTAGTACNAPGATDIKYGCISAITAQGRTSCYVNNR